MDILTRLENLENFVFALSEKIDRNKFYADADTAGNRQGVSNNTTGIEENSEGLFDIAALADENSEAIMELAEMIAEMEG